MSFDPAKHRRRSIRLKGFDYSQPGAYFVTLVAHGREPLFGQIEAGEMRPSRFGHIVERAWQDLPNHYPHVTLDAFCLMPNHVHAVIVLNETAGRGGSAQAAQGSSKDTIIASEDSYFQRETRPYEGEPSRRGLPEIVRALKSYSARRINLARRMPGVPVWQRNYYEHIVRDEGELEAIRGYIDANPLNWADDPERA